MYALRHIYDDAQDTIPVPEAMRHQRIEVIFMVLDEQTQASVDTMPVGDRMASFFKDIPPATCPEEEFQLPVREMSRAVDFE